MLSASYIDIELKYKLIHNFLGGLLLKLNKNQCKNSTVVYNVNMLCRVPLHAERYRSYGEGNNMLFPYAGF